MMLNFFSFKLQVQRQALLREAGREAAQKEPATEKWKKKKKERNLQVYAVKVPIL